MKKKQCLVALAALGLCAATAVPALALENEFHGMFGVRYHNSNFNGAESTDVLSGTGFYNPDGKNKNLYSANYVEQRARLQYIAKANADLKLVTAFELDYNYWGNSSYAVGRGSGGAIGADSVNIETKSIYLDVNPFKNVNVKVGMMPYNDSFKGTLFDADMAGVLVSSSYGKFTPSIGYFRFHDKGENIDNVLGHKTNDMFALDGKYEVSNALKVGGAYYFFRDGQPNTDVKIHTLGLNAEYVSGPLTLNGFAVYETGWNNKKYINAFAGNAGAKLKVGPGVARSEFLYVSGGDRNAFYSIDGEHGYYDNEMVILGRDKNAFFTIDNSILYNVGNNGQGQIGGYIGYDLPINEKLTTAFNAGFAATAKNTANRSSKYLGTEINAEANYKMFENLTTSVRAGYVFLGDYFKGVAKNGETPVDPYDVSLIVKYTF